jgi:hypothetical protein
MNKAIAPEDFRVVKAKFTSQLETSLDVNMLNPNERTVPKVFDSLLYMLFATSKSEDNWNNYKNRSKLDNSHGKNSMMYLGMVNYFKVGSLIDITSGIAIYSMPPDILWQEFVGVAKYNNINYTVNRSKESGIPGITKVIHNISHTENLNFKVDSVITKICGSKLVNIKENALDKLLLMDPTVMPKYFSYFRDSNLLLLTSAIEIDSLKIITYLDKSNSILTHIPRDSTIIDQFDFATLCFHLINDKSGMISMTETIPFYIYGKFMYASDWQL